MIINVYALLAGSVALLRLLLGALLGILGWSVWRQWRNAAYAEQRAVLEERSYLLFLLACFLAVLNVASWPLLYLVLQSYVPAWPGVMCLYGVMRIGVGSEGPSGYLPGLLGLLQALKPALVFLTGVWVVLYSAHRQSRTAWLLRPILALLCLVGVASSLDALAEIAYLVIPKQNALLSSGCCPVPDPFVTALADHAGSSVQGAAAWLPPLYFLAGLGMVVGLQFYRTRVSRHRRVLLLSPLLLLATAAFGLCRAFVTEALTPALLRLPGHHCVYDLIPRAPHIVLALMLFAWGSLSMGWLVVAELLARNPETAIFRDKLIDGIARRAEFAYALSLALIFCALLGARL